MNATSSTDQSWTTATVKAAASTVNVHWIPMVTALPTVCVRQRCTTYLEVLGVWFQIARGRPQVDALGERRGKRRVHGRLERRERRRVVARVPGRRLARADARHDDHRAALPTRQRGDGCISLRGRVVRVGRRRDWRVLRSHTHHTYQCGHDPHQIRRGNHARQIPLQINVVVGRERGVM